MHAFRIYDKMKSDDETGARPMYRPSNWNVAERRMEKSKKKKNWSNKGGYLAPIIIPSTPNGELAAILQKVVDDECDKNMRFKIIEKGGAKIKRKLQISNPLETAGCSDTQCIACKETRGAGGKCRKSNVNYSVGCKLCPEDGKSVYIGETSRNLYTRGTEHMNKFESRKADSFMLKHQTNNHPGQPIDFQAKVIGTFNDCLSRQVAEGVEIRRCEYQVMNAKTEWHQPALWKIRSEVERV